VTRALTPNPKPHPLNPVPDGPYRTYGEETVNRMLRWACQSGNVKLIEDLVKSGGNVSHIDPQVPWPPLHWAIIGRQYDAIRALIRLGASPSQRAGDALTPIQVSSAF
jgi:hypothetical protein